MPGTLPLQNYQERGKDRGFKRREKGGKKKLSEPNMTCGKVQKGHSSLEAGWNPRNLKANRWSTIIFYTWKWEPEPMVDSIYVAYSRPNSPLTAQKQMLVQFQTLPCTYQIKDEHDRPLLRMVIHCWGWNPQSRMTIQRQNPSKWIELWFYQPIRTTDRFSHFIDFRSVLIQNSPGHNFFLRHSPERPDLEQSTHNTFFSL